MEVPPEITFRGLEKTEAIEAHIYRWTDKLDEIHSGIISCRIAVENDQEHQRSGSPFRVRVVVRVPPGKELIGRHEAGQGEINEHLPAVISEAFEAVRRQLIKTKDKLQGEVKGRPRAGRADRACDPVVHRQGLRVFTHARRPGIIFSSECGFKRRLRASGSGNGCALFSFRRRGGTSGQFRADH
jgi:ribosome-associated translation inhibitor RaiA